MTASPTPTAAVPGDVGLPSEEAIARIVSVTGAVSPKTIEKARAILSLIRPAFEAKEREIEEMRKLATEHLQARYHAESREHNAHLAVQEERKLAEAAEAKLAQAVEAMEPFDDALGEDDEGYGGGLTVVMKWGACTDYSVTLQDLRDLRKAARSASRGER